MVEESDPGFYFVGRLFDRRAIVFLTVSAPQSQPFMRLDVYIRVDLRRSRLLSRAIQGSIYKRDALGFVALRSRVEGEWLALLGSRS